MNEVDKLINEITLGKFERAFESLKPNDFHFMIFSEDYNKTQKWSVSRSQGLIFYRYDVTIYGWEMKLTWDEKKRLDKAMQSAYIQSRKAWKARRAQIKG